MKALLRVGDTWIKIQIVAWVPGPNGEQPSAVYHKDSDKTKTLYCAPLYSGLLSQIRVA